MSLSSKSCNTYTSNCNVFLSFISQDTRRSRTFVSYLRDSLHRKGYTTTELGNESSWSESDPFVVDRDITESKVAVVVISEKFVSSPWCLESLVKILEFHESGSLGVLIPVFLEINPMDVITQSGIVREQFSSHEIENPAKVQTWRQALSQVADISSCHYSEIWKGDAELIGKITDDIWDFLIGSRSVDFCGLVGMDRHMKAMYRLLDLGLMDEIRWIHIWGRREIGKTELAKYLYEEMQHHFDTRVWLDDLDHYGNDLEGILHCELRRNLYRGNKQRVLLVLDNVNRTNHFVDKLRKVVLVYFGPGSRVIIATREKLYHDISHVVLPYEVVGLEFSEALQLFCFHAFEGTHYYSLSFEDLSSRAVKLTGGCPLTIKKLGSRLSGRDRKEWGDILSGYESVSNNGIIDSGKIVLSNHSSVTDGVSLQPSTSNSSDLVGMDHRFQAVLELLELGSDKEVRVLGIWGTGGIGKTTLATYAYERILQQFHTHVFLENPQEQSSSFCLEERFLSKVKEREAFAVRNSKADPDVTKSGIRHSKILLIVDGVENDKALEDVMKMADWFEPGSRIIATTGDESLLLANGVKHVYEVKCLRLDEALQLFYIFAQTQEPPSDRFKQLSVRAIKLVGFCPLALKVTASMLSGKHMNHWETILQSFETKQNKGKLPCPPL